MTGKQGPKGSERGNHEATWMTLPKQEHPRSVSGRVRRQKEEDSKKWQKNVWWGGEWEHAGLWGTVRPRLLLWVCWEATCLATWSRGQQKRCHLRLKQASLHTEREGNVDNRRARRGSVVSLQFWTWEPGETDSQLLRSEPSPWGPGNGAVKQQAQQKGRLGDQNFIQYLHF